MDQDNDDDPRMLSPEQMEALKRGELRFEAVVIANPRKLASQVKQVLVVRKDLNMRKGKIAAQCGHAVMKVILDRMIVRPDTDNDAATVREFLFSYARPSAWASWLEGKYTKICVSVNSEAELLEVYEKAKLVAPASLIQDSGLTEFGGVPTYTVVAVGPAWADEIDPITGHLPLL